MDQLDKIINILSMEIREWHAHNIILPELAKIVRDKYMYAKVVKYVKSCKDLNKDMLEGLEEILMD